MASQGPLLSSHVVDGIGTVPFINPSNAQAEDGVFSTCADAGVDAALNADTFGFSIPAGATINGIQIEIKIKTTNTDSAGVYSLVPLTFPNSINFSPTTTLTWLSVGGSSQLFGGSPTPTSINAAGFGVQLIWTQAAVAGTCSVDAFRVTVFYTAAGGGVLQRIQGTVDVKSTLQSTLRRGIDFGVQMVGIGLAPSLNMRVGKDITPRSGLILNSQLSLTGGTSILNPQNQNTLFNREYVGY